MIVPQDQLGPIARGEIDELHLPGLNHPPAVGAVVAIHRTGRKAICRVLILDHWPHREGGHVVRFEPHTEQPLRLLNRSGRHPYYTDDPDHGYPGEGEAVDAETLARFAMDSGQDAAARTARYEQHLRERPLADRLRDLEAAHDGAAADLSRILVGVRRRIEAAERKLRQRDAA